MNRSLSDKMKYQAGETIAEVLVALLISSLALVMLASMISSTQSMVAKSEQKMNAYYDVNNKLESLNTEDKKGELTPVITMNGKTISCSAVPYYVNDQLAHEVYSYG